MSDLSDLFRVFSQPAKKRGRPRKTIDEHLADGTFRKDRYGHLLPETSSTIDRRPATRPRAECGDPSRWAKTIADERAIASGCYFDEARAAFVVEWFRKYLRHSVGRWAGQPFELLDWQREDVIYPLFGWMRADGKRRFRRTFIFLPKKNGKSTLASGIGLYMLAGDGEYGAEVYSAATDKDQASIVHGEAINMVDASLPLSHELKINRSTRNILYKKTRGFYRVLSSKPQGSEGLKGNCCIIDELHAWYGRDLWDSLRYMGKAREEPLIFVITTAGKDVDTVCYDEYQHAKEILAGNAVDDRLFCYIRELPKDMDFREPEAAAIANPSLGHTIDADDFAKDVEEAANNPATLAAMLRYSFNVWTSGESTWIGPADWHECGEQYDATGLEGRTCFLGLDLSKTRDMTAAVLAFPPLPEEDPELVRLLPFFWLPAPYAKAHDHLRPFSQWGAAGHLTLTADTIVDYAAVEEAILNLCQRFRVAELVYDPLYASEITSRISDKAGIDRVEFPQTMVHYGPACAEFQRRLVGHKLRHPQHPVLSWQAGHCTVLEDRNGNVRPAKPRENDWRKVDGIVAAIMACSRAFHYRASGSLLYF